MVYVVISNGFFSINDAIFSGSYTDSYTIDLCDLTTIVDISSEKITIYPNPSSGNFIFSSSDNIISVKVYDVNGKTIYKRASNNQTININLSSEKSGVYAAHITNIFGETSVHKLVIQ